MATQPPDNDTFPRQHARTRRFTVGQPRNIRVTPDGSRVLFLRSTGPADPILRLWSIDLSDDTPGPETMLANPTELGSDEADLPAAERARRERARESAGGIVSYALAPNGSLVTFALAGELFVTDLVDGTTRAVSTSGNVFDPRPNHDGTLVAYVSGQELRVVGVADTSDATRAEDQLVATAPSPLVSWGRADFIAAEEMGRSRGFWWSPDDNTLLATRVDDEPVNSWWIADPAHPNRQPTEIRYPAAGSTNPGVELYVLTPPEDQSNASSSDGWARQSIDWQGECEYLADVVWAAEHHPLIVRQTRNQRIVEVVELDIKTLSQTVRHTITDDTWVELMPGSPTWFGDQLLTIEDRSDLDRRVVCLDGQPIAGTEHLHIKAVLATNGGRVTTTAWNHPTEVHVVSIDPAAGSVTMLTSEPGVHTASVGDEVIVTTSVTPTAPGSATSIHEHLGVGEPLGGLVAQITSLADAPVIECQPIFCELGPRKLNAAVLLPADHDGASPLPVLLDPYGGPHAQRVLKTHNGHLTSQWFADQGYAVLVIDGRGTPGRGPAFEREVYGDLAQPVLDDQIEGLDAAAELFPFLDLDRVGIRGWSFGGYLAALAVLRRPDRVHAAIAGAPVTSWQLYDTHYTERYLGHPQNDAAHYERTDLLNEAAALTRPLFLIHGMSDDNVVAAHSLQMSSALLAAGRTHQVLPLSGVTHMTPQEVVAENLLHLQRDFLAANLQVPEA